MRRLGWKQKLALRAAAGRGDGWAGVPWQTEPLTMRRVALLEEPDSEGRILGREEAYRVLRRLEDAGLVQDSDWCFVATPTGRLAHMTGQYEPCPK